MLAFPGRMKKNRHILILSAAMTARPLHLTTYNIHKGFSQFNRRLMVHDLRQQLRALNPDLLFLQEVQGLHQHHANRHGDWPELPQHEFLAEDHWHASYGANMAYEHGHHGNAILSRHPILASHNQDVTHLQFERRGLLHTQVQPAGWSQPLHCVCAHLSLFGTSRRRQMQALIDKLEQVAPPGTPLIIAGDFNDWSNAADRVLVRQLGLTEAFEVFGQQPRRSFPARLPLFRLDRIYVRDLKIEHAEVHWGGSWARISDHAALSAWITPANGAP